MAPMRMEPKAAQRQVAAVTAAMGMPVWERMEGFTKMMYAIVMKVVSPARVSVRQLVRSWAKWKYFSSFVTTTHPHRFAQSIQFMLLRSGLPVFRAAKY